MGLNEVKDDILSSAREKAEEIINNAKKEIMRIEEENAKTLKNMENSGKEESMKELSALERKETASAELEAKKYLLEKKKELINGVFEEAKKKIIGMPKQQKSALLKNLIEKAKRQTEIEYVYCNNNEKPLISGNYKLIAADISGGIIVENNDKSIRIDYSYDTILESIHEKTLQEIAGILF